MIEINWIAKQENHYCHGWLKLTDYLDKKIIIVMENHLPGRRYVGQVFIFCCHGWLELTGKYL